MSGLGHGGQHGGHHGGHHRAMVVSTGDEGIDLEEAVVLPAVVVAEVQMPVPEDVSSDITEEYDADNGLGTFGVVQATPKAVSAPMPVAQTDSNLLFGISVKTLALLALAGGAYWYLSKKK